MTQPISPAFLRNLKPLDTLDAADLELLADKGRVEAVAERTVIFRKDGDDDWVRYLLSGEVVLALAPGETRTLVATGREGVPDEPLAWSPPWPCATSTCSRTGGGASKEPPQPGSRPCRRAFVHTSCSTASTPSCP